MDQGKGEVVEERGLSQVTPLRSQFSTVYLSFPISKVMVNNASRCYLDDLCNALVTRKAKTSCLVHSR